MPQPLLNSFPHHCFHSHRVNVHQYPDLYRCDKGAAHSALMEENKAQADHPNYCTASIHINMAKQAGLVDDKGNVSCPICGGTTTLVPGQKLAEIHTLLCTDETLHYPEMRKAGTITEDEYQTWKGTLSHDEKLGLYKRVPDIQVMASFTHEETALMDSDPQAFVALVNTRFVERAENALLHQVPYRHQTTSFKRHMLLGIWRS